VPADDYELMEGGETGIVRLYGIYGGDNNLRVTYTAGYKIDFDNPTNANNHTLPQDLTDLAERLIARLYKKRESEGRNIETLDGGSSITWGSFLTDEDKDIIGRFRRTRII
jgi:1-acyl-sn-glycerol-3-phosphate acyltransferase